MIGVVAVSALAAVAVVGSVLVSRGDVLSRGAVHVEVAERPVVVLAVPGQASALDASGVADGADVGTTGVFSAVLDGEELTFSPAGDGFVDDVTGSTWDVQGRALSGPPRGRSLERLPSTDTFRFSWQSFRPDTAFQQ
jgi:hypothetical protein